MPPRPRPFTILFLAAFLFAVCFQGSRGLWSPDEGYYVGAADGMVKSGSALVPLLNGRVFLEKPPLTYWGIAAGLKALGQNEWGARLFHALCFSLTVLVVALLGRRLWDPRTGLIAGVLYLLSPIPFAASNIVTPDTPLALWTALLMLLFLRGLEEKSRRSICLTLAGLVLGLGVLTKGPAMLLFAAPLPVIAWQRRKTLGMLASPGTWIGAGLGVLVGCSWYFWMSGHVPGAGGFFWDNQVMGRLITDKYQRNAGWFGWLIYLPVLALGALPGSLVWLKRTAKGGEDLKSPEGKLLAAWFFIPLTVLCLAQSRLPLYALPLFAPLALLNARRLDGLLQGRNLWDLRWARTAVILMLFILGALKIALVNMPSRQDLRLLWNDIQGTGLKQGEELVLTEWNEEGLGFYAGHHLDTVTLAGTPYPSFIPPEDFRSKCDRAIQEGRSLVFLCPSNRANEYTYYLRSKFKDVSTVELPRGRSLLRCSRPIK